MSWTTLHLLSFLGLVVGIGSGSGVLLYGAEVAALITEATMTTKKAAILATWFQLDLALLLWADKTLSDEMRAAPAFKGQDQDVSSPAPVYDWYYQIK